MRLCNGMNASFQFDKANDQNIGRARSTISRNITNNVKLKDMTNNNENRRAIRKWNTTGRRESQKPQTVASEIKPRSYSPDSERDYGSEEPSRRHQ